MIENTLHGIAFLLFVVNIPFLFISLISALIDDILEKIVWCFALAAWIYGMNTIDDYSNVYLLLLSQVLCFWFNKMVFFCDIRILPRGENVVYYSKDE